MLSSAAGGTEGTILVLCSAAEARLIGLRDDASAL
jgi:hypothetical protein